ncbi:MAG TPA: CoA ester lyase [Caulobacterales bacterium]|nr:CoA ester lyase [Caulobacterales bacterium]
MNKADRPNSMRPRRSALYMPGANVKALEKAKAVPADVLIFDIEDSVAPEGKAEARANIVSVLQAGGYGAREIVVRVNSLSTPWGAEDVKAAAAAKPHAVLFPKVSSAADVEAAEASLRAAGAPADTGLWAMIETPLAILNIRDIAAASAKSRLACFVVGTNDLAKDQRAQTTPGREAFLASLTLCVLAARAFGLSALDGVHNDIADAAGFEAVCRQGAMLGFDGKTLIHPSQLGPCNEIFAPAAGEVEQAHAIIAAFAAPENAGKGVIKVAGRMTELLHLEQARRTVAIAEAISAMA